MSTPFKILSFQEKQKDKHNFSKELGESFKQWVFAGIKDHNIDKDLVRDVISLFSEFFSLSRDIKDNYYKPDLGGARGYTPIKIETPKDHKIKSPKETGATFLENSLIKARYYSHKSKMPSIADD